MPTVCAASAAGWRWPIVPASITVVTPLSKLSTSVGVSSDAVVDRRVRHR